VTLHLKHLLVRINYTDVRKIFISKKFLIRSWANIKQILCKEIKTITGLKADGTPGQSKGVFFNIPVFFKEVLAPIVTT
jgi:hypothetical protein